VSDRKKFKTGKGMWEVRSGGRGGGERGGALKTGLGGDIKGTKRTTR